LCRTEKQNKGLIVIFDKLFNGGNTTGAMKRSFITVLVIIVLLAACRKKEVIPDPGTTQFDNPANDALYGLMNDWYFWYNLMPSVNAQDYTDPYLLMDALRYKTLDRWSFVQDYAEFKAYYAGSFVGHGFRIGLDETNKARIVFIYNNSPLYDKGVRRGWIVKKINGYDIAAILKSEDGAAYSAAIGPAAEGVSNTFIFGKPDGTEVTITSTNSSVAVNSVLLYDCRTSCI
jgi:carboxyl-terminal processing protease